MHNDFMDELDITEEQLDYYLDHSTQFDHEFSAKTLLLAILNKEEPIGEIRREIIRYQEQIYNLTTTKTN